MLEYPNTERGRRGHLDMALLAHLARHELSGYDLVASMRFPVGLFWQARQSQIYTELKALEARGWVRVREAPGRRAPRRRLYSVSEEGLRALRAWVEAPPAPAPVRDELTLRIYALWLIDREAAIRLVTDQQAQWQGRLKFFEDVIAEWRQRAGDRLRLANTPEFSNLLTMMRGRARAREQVAFCIEAREALEAAAGGDPDTSWIAEQPLRHRVTRPPT